MPSIEQTFTLQVPSSTVNLAMIREFVARVGGMAGFGENDVAKLELAVDEACANVIEHAYDSDTTKQVSVRATFDDEQIQIEIIDRGRGFDPSSIPQQDLDQLIAQRRSGGLGLRLIRTIMDDVQYQIVPGEKNELRMVKKIRKP
ncbi:MAG: ATP-binding protein [Acidobacteria bacterium]|nr:ATP-binding protein [Acidobacteriota bacterium]